MVTLVEKTQVEPMMKVQNLEEQFFLARPRLMRLARRYGIGIDAVDDVVQETFLYAWHHLDQLYSLDVLVRWLDGICRNFCLRWRRAYALRSLREMSISAHIQDDEMEFGLIDASQQDPLEELERQDLHILLDRALGYLSETARAVLELCYLQEMPQSEIAAQLGLTTNALDVRLHRARRRLHNILQKELRDDAERFGFPVNDEAQHWYQTRLWCGFCGKHRLRGCFEIMADGKINLRVCCPSCSREGEDLLCTSGRYAISSKRSFVAALRQVGSEIYQQHSLMIEGVCPYCHAQGQIYSVAYGEIPETMLLFPPHLLKCHLCGAMSALAIADYVRTSHTLVQNFSEQHPRSILSAQNAIDYNGQAAIRYSLADTCSTAQLTVTVHERTLQVLALN